MPNDWTVGVQYDPSFNNVQWSQPGGPGTQVFPAQVSGGFDLLSTKEFNSRTGQYIFGCQHSGNYCFVVKALDEVSGQDVALICCCQCSYVNRYIIDFQTAMTNSLIDGILYP